MTRKRLFALLLVVVMLVGVVGPAAAQDRKIVTVIFQQEFDSLNPMYTTMTYTGMTRDFYLFGAWNFDGELNPNPILVTEIPNTENGGISEDGTVITLNLRDDIVWSDGEPITSADFVFTYEMVTSDANTPLSRYPYTEEIVASVEAPDETTVVINFVEPFAPWLSSIFDWVLPEHVLGPVFEADGTIDNAEWNRAPMVGSGPFVFQEWESGSHVLFVRNENFFDGTAILDGVFVRFVPDDASAVAALEAGDGDISYFLAPSDVVAVEATGNVTVSWVPGGYNEGWFFNLDPETAHPAMLDVNVRRALILATDRWTICEDLMLGFFHPPASFWEDTPYSPADLEPIPYDPVEAARLLDEAGWVDSDGDGVRDQDGVDLRLRYLTPPRQVRMDTQVVVQQAFTDLGIDLILENPSYDIFWNSYGSGGPIATGQYDFAQWSSNTAFPDPDVDTFLCSEIPSEESPEGNNWMNYCNPEVDALFIEQAQTTDTEARVELFHDIARLMADDVVWVGIWTDPDNYAVNNRVLNTAVNGPTPFWNAVVWDIAQ